MNRLLDLRFVIGLFFVITGSLLLIYSFVTAQPDQSSINRWSGLLFLLFGIGMVYLHVGTYKNQDDKLD